MRVVCVLVMMGVGQAGTAVNSPDSPEQLCKDQCLYLWHGETVCVCIIHLVETSFSQTR